jgi:hypothetical protein
MIDMKHTLIKMFASLVLLFGIMALIVATCSAQMCKDWKDVSVYNGNISLLPYDGDVFDKFLKKEDVFIIQPSRYAFSSGRANIHITVDTLYSILCGTGYMHYTEWVERDAIKHVEVLSPAKICINDNLDAIICIPYIDTLILQKHK